MRQKYGVYFVGVLLLLTACYKNNLQDLSNIGDCITTNISYNRDIRPIISMHCNASGCHNSGTTTTFPLDSYEALKYAVLNQPVVKSIQHDAGALPMPKNVSKLSECNIARITEWINQGSPNN